MTYFVHAGIGTRTYDEPIDVPAARSALAEGSRRAAALRGGKADWVDLTGPRGYLSRIDGSVQPFLLIVPDGYAAHDSKAPGEANDARTRMGRDPGDM